VSSCLQGLRCYLRRALESLLECDDVSRHFLAGLPEYRERNEQLADAVAFEVDRDGDPGAHVRERCDADVDERTDRSVDSAHAPGARRSARTTSEVLARLAKPILRAVTHRGVPTVTVGSMRPLTTPRCHSPNRDGSVVYA
jgi:hypothetical protein